MIIANVPVPQLAIPGTVRDMARRPHVFTSSAETPWDATDWAACSEAWPHTDDEWNGKLFLTLTVLGFHELCDAKHYAATEHDGVTLEAGTLAVVDPMVLHWLRPRRDDEPWVAVQWEVSRRRAKARAREIVKQLGGRWVDTTDARYARWRPAA